jgi:hypothetical protein
MNLRNGEELLASPTPNPQAGGLPLIVSPRVLIRYIPSYPPYLEAVSSIRNLRTCKAMVTHLTLEYAIRKVQENQVGLKFYGTHQVLVFADDVNLLGDNVDTIKINSESLIDASKNAGLEVNREKLSTCCCLVTRMRQNHDIKIGNTAFEKVAQFTYLGMTVTYQNLIQENIER